MSMLNVNGVDLELDLMDADVMERYERMNKEIAEKVQGLANQPGTNAEKMRAINDEVRNYFDEIFGEGTAQEVFGDTQKLDTYLEAFGTVASASNGLADKVQSITDKYGLGRAQNREQRRHGGQQFNGQNRFGGGK